MNNVKLSLIISLVFFAGVRPITSQAVNASASEVRCPVSVYIFLDISLSLHGDQGEYLKRGLTDLLATNNSLFPDDTKIYLVPFANEPAKLDRYIDNPSQLGKAIDMVLASVHSKKNQWGLDTKKTDIKAVLEKILDIAKNGQGRQPYTVFVIASDFEHDPNNKPAEVEFNREDWGDFFSDKAAEFYSDFDARGANRALLLLDVSPEVSGGVALNVITDLTSAGTLGKEKIQTQVAIFNLSDNPFDNAIFMSYLKPIDIKVGRHGTVGSGGAILTIQAHNRSCLLVDRIGQLGYYVKVRTAHERFPRILKEDNLDKVQSSRDWEGVSIVKEDDFKNANIKVEDIDSNAASYIVDVKLPSSTPSQSDRVVGSTGINTKDYLLVSTLKSTLEDRSLRTELNLQGSLSDEGPVVLKLNVLQLGESLATREVPINALDVSRGVLSFDLTMPFDSIEEVCYHQALGLGIQLRSNKPNILAHDGETIALDVNGKPNGEHLLQEIFEQASFPAVITAGLTLFFVWRRADEIEKVEKVLGVTALVSTTVLVLLHRLTRAETLIDGAMLSPVIVRTTACFTVLFLFLVMVSIIYRGGLPLARTEEALSADFSYIVASRRRWGVDLDRRTWLRRISEHLTKWGRMAALIILLAALCLSSYFIGVDTRKKMSCSFGFIQYPSQPQSVASSATYPVE
jgi:hypothetical protein